MTGQSCTHAPQWCSTGGARAGCHKAHCRPANRGCLTLLHPSVPGELHAAQAQHSNHVHRASVGQASNMRLDSNIVMLARGSSTNEMQHELRHPAHLHKQHSTSTHARNATWPATFGLWALQQYAVEQPVGSHRGTYLQLLPKVY
jgi:hypothetical protein